MGVSSEVTISSSSSSSHPPSVLLCGILIRTDALPGPHQPERTSIVYISGAGSQCCPKPQDQDPTVAVNHLRGRGTATRTQETMKVCRFNKLLKCSNDFPLPVALPLRPLHIRLPCDDVEISRDVSRINKEAVTCNEARSISACPSRRPRSDTNGAGEFEVTVRDFNATHET